MPVEQRLGAHPGRAPAGEDHAAEHAATAGSYAVPRSALDGAQVPPSARPRRPSPSDAQMMASPRASGGGRVARATGRDETAAARRVDRRPPAPPRHRRCACRACSSISGTCAGGPAAARRLAERQHHPVHGGQARAGRRPPAAPTPARRPAEPAVVPCGEDFGAARVSRMSASPTSSRPLRGSGRRDRRCPPLRGGSTGTGHARACAARSHAVFTTRSGIRPLRPSGPTPRAARPRRVPLSLTAASPAPGSSASDVGAPSPRLRRQRRTARGSRRAIRGRRRQLELLAARRRPRRTRPAARPSRRARPGWSRPCARTRHRRRRR